jgi:aromatic-L-amino-acid decarboxylase
VDVGLWDKETLDPEDWDKMKALGHKMLDDMMNFLKDIRTHPFKFPTEDAIKVIKSPLTDDGEGEEKVYEVFLNSILPYTGLVVKPQFWGFVLGTGSPYGMLTEMLIARARAEHFGEVRADAKKIGITRICC